MCRLFWRNVLNNWVQFIKLRDRPGRQLCACGLVVLHAVPRRNLGRGRRDVVHQLRRRHLELVRGRDVRVDLRAVHRRQLRVPGVHLLHDLPAWPVGRCGRDILHAVRGGLEH